MHLVKSPAAGWAACALIAGIVLVGLIRPWGIGLDFANFYDAGHKAALGEFAGLYDSQALIGGQPPLSNMAFFSAPITSYLYAPMAALPPQVALLLFKLVATAAMTSGLLLLYRHSGAVASPGDITRFGLFAVAALLFQPFWTIYRVGGQTSPVVFLLLVLAHVAFIKGRSVPAALLLAAAVLVKPAFAPLAVLVFALADSRFRVTALMTGIVVAALSLVLFGWDLHAAFLSRIASEAGNLLAPWKNSSPLSWIEALFVTPEAFAAGGAMPTSLARGLLALRVAVAVAVLWTLRWQIVRPLAPAARRHAVFTAGLLLIVTLSPVVWAHYLTILFIPLAYLIAGRETLSPGVRVAVCTAVVLAVFQNLILVRQIEKLSGYDQQWEVVTIAVIRSLPALLFLGIWLFGRQSVARSLARPEWAGAA